MRGSLQLKNLFRVAKKRVSVFCISGSPNELVSVLRNPASTTLYSPSPPGLFLFQGRHTNGSQFYVTLQPTSWMDTKYVAFGKLVEGGDLLDKLEALETYNQRPKDDVVITASGLLHEAEEGN